MTHDVTHDVIHDVSLRGRACEDVSEQSFAEMWFDEGEVKQVVIKMVSTNKNNEALAGDPKGFKMHLYGASDLLWCC